MITEVIGVLGSVFVLISMLFNTDSRKGALLLRYLNNAGSVLFIIYGWKLCAWSMLALNVVVLAINSYYIVKLHRSKEKGQTK